MIINISNIGSTGGGGSDVDEKLKQIEEKINQIDEKLLVYISSADDSNVNIIKVTNKTKAQYDAIEYKDDNTLYIIDEEENFIKFSTNGNDACSVSLTNNGDNAPVMEYSIDGAMWQSWDYSAINFDKNTPVYFRGINEAGFSSSSSKYSNFSLTGSNVSVGGNVMSLINYETLPDTIPNSYCFYYLFINCSILKSVSKHFLPATTLKSDCYDSMFWRCTSLKNAPALPATTLASSCYNYMFYGCTSLVTAPELPATSLTSGCYQRMFYNCTSLVTAPEILPATTLTYADNCYSNMFHSCTSLVNAPYLPAETLSNYCYYQMFSNCTSLNEVHCNATNISAYNCTTNWLYNVPSTGTFYKNPNATDWTTGYNGIPEGWTVVDETI